MRKFNNLFILLFVFMCSVLVSCKMSVAGGSGTSSDSHSAVAVNIPVVSVELNKAVLILNLGRTEMLNSTVLPTDSSNKTVSWKSSDELIVTVSDSGLVTPVGVGKTSIIVTTKDGSKTATCNVSVYNFTEIPVLLEDYDGTIGTEGFYYQFGDWPQTIKAPDVEIIEDVPDDITGYYLGSDGYYYEKFPATPYKGGVKYSDAEGILKDESDYFKVEPIVWREVTDSFSYDGENKAKLFISEKILTTGIPFYDKDEPRTVDGDEVRWNNYKYSIIRSYLNGLNGSEYGISDYRNSGFAQKAFTSLALSKINITNVDNSEKSTRDEKLTIRDGNIYACANTNDKIFLPSEKEITTGIYGFSDNPQVEDDARKRKVTDFAKAVGMAYNRDLGNWWLRSPRFENGYQGRRVTEAGKAYNYNKEYKNYFLDGIVPALSISF